MEPEIVFPSGKYGATAHPRVRFGDLSRPVVQVVEQFPGYWRGTPGSWFAEDAAEFTGRASIQGNDWCLSVEDTAALAQFAREQLA